MTIGPRRAEARTCRKMGLASSPLTAAGVNPFYILGVCDCNWIENADVGEERTYRVTCRGRVGVCTHVVALG